VTPIATPHRTSLASAELTVTPTHRARLAISDRRPARLSSPRSGTGPGTRRGKPDGNQFSLAVTSNPGVPRGRRATTDLSGRRDGLRTSGRIIGSLATRQGLTSPVGVSHGACFATQIAH
jgi:hypothetical protein